MGTNYPYIIFLPTLLSVFALFTDQEERNQSLTQFRSGDKDVLVATDVASKGLDFPDIQHVINYDMPEDIENYGELWLLTHLNFCHSDKIM